MKEITIKGVTLHYETTYGYHEGESVHTNFYIGTTLITKKKWVFCGPTYEEVVLKKVFTIYADTMNVRLSKSWWNSKISEQLDLINRAMELERGELI